jgi:hypothetical protein
MLNLKCPIPPILPKGILSPNSVNMSNAMLRSQKIRTNKATNPRGLRRFQSSSPSGVEGQSSYGITLSRCK